MREIKVIVLIFTFIVILYIIALAIPTYATWCYNENGCTFTRFYVEASITGTDTTNSNGYGYAEGGFTDKYFGICPSGKYGGNYMSGYMFSDYEYTRFYGPIDNSYYHYFNPPAGRAIGVSIDHDYCECGTQNLPSVIAWLTGGCSV
jgi:hypothetical protein